jgi:hypothetical protein
VANTSSGHTLSNSLQQMSFVTNASKVYLFDLEMQRFPDIRPMRLTVLKRETHDLIVNYVRIRRVKAVRIMNLLHWTELSREAVRNRTTAEMRQFLESSKSLLAQSKSESEEWKRVVTLFDEDRLKLPAEESKEQAPGAAAAQGSGAAAGAVGAVEAGEAGEAAGTVGRQGSAGQANGGRDCDMRLLITDGRCICQ